MNSYFIDGDVFLIPENGKSDIHCPNGVKLLIVCFSEDYKLHSELLHNILKAIRFENNKNAQIIQLHSEEVIQLSAIELNEVEHIISFGLQPKQLHLNAGFKANTFYKTEGFSIMLTHSLDQLNANKNYKMALWNALQKAFS